MIWHYVNTHIFLYSFVMIHRSLLLSGFDFVIISQCRIQNIYLMVTASWSFISRFHRKRQEKSIFFMQMNVMRSEILAHSSLIVIQSLLDRSSRLCTMHINMMETIMICLSMQKNSGNHLLFSVNRICLFLTSSSLR